MPAYKCTVCGFEQETLEDVPAPTHCGKQCELIEKGAAGPVETEEETAEAESEETEQ